MVGDEHGVGAPGRRGREHLPERQPLLLPLGLADADREVEHIGDLVAAEGQLRRIHRSAIGTAQDLAHRDSKRLERGADLAGHLAAVGREVPLGVAPAELRISRIRLVRVGGGVAEIDDVAPAAQRVDEVALGEDRTRRCRLGEGRGRSEADGDQEPEAKHRSVSDSSHAHTPYWYRLMVPGTVQSYAKCNLCKKQ